MLNLLLKINNVSIQNHSNYSVVSFDSPDEINQYEAFTLLKHTGIKASDYMWSELLKETFTHGNKYQLILRQKAKYG